MFMDLLDFHNCEQEYKIKVYDITLSCSGVPRGGVGVFKPPPKFRSFDKAEPNSQFRGKYIRNNLTRILLSLIFELFREKTSLSAVTPTVVFFFSPRHDVT